MTVLPGPSGPGGKNAAGSLPSLSSSRLGWLMGALLAVVVVAVLGRVVLEAANAAARVESLRQANAELRAEVQALLSEKQLVTSPVFVQVAGRGYGYGQPNERVFGLAPGAPPPSPLIADEAGAPLDQPSPLDAWLALLFGR